MALRLTSLTTPNDTLWPVKAAIAGVVALQVADVVLRGRRKLKSNRATWRAEVQHKQFDAIVEAGLAEAVRWTMRPRTRSG